MGCAAVSGRRWDWKCCLRSWCKGFGLQLKALGPDPAVWGGTEGRGTAPPGCVAPCERAELSMGEGSQEG